MKIVQLVRHLRDAANRYLGAEAELTVDLSNWDLRIHDGATHGGRVIQARDNADERYQARSPELEGFAVFEPQQRGILVRIGPAEYRLRRILGNDDNITVEKGNGFDGNPVISLAAVIESNHTWSGAHTVTGPWAFNDGLMGDLVGNVTGDLEGNVVGNLTGDATGNFVGTFQGAVDLRESELLIDDDQIPLRAVAGIEDLISDTAIPAGLICMWAGSTETIPAGWAICDGTQGTPNLTDRFVIGAGTSLAAGEIGGTLGHSHPVTVTEAGAHTHPVTGIATSSSPTGVTLTPTTFRVENEQQQETMLKSATISDPGHSHTTSGMTDSSGAHIHTASSEAAEHIPPYYALAFIMRL